MSYVYRVYTTIMSKYFLLDLLAATLAVAGLLFESPFVLLLGLGLFLWICIKSFNSIIRLRQIPPKKQEKTEIEKHELWKKLSEKRKGRTTFRKENLDVYDAFQKDYTSFYPYTHFHRVIARDRESQWCVYLYIDLESSQLIEIDDCSQNRFKYHSTFDISRDDAYKILNSDLETRKTIAEKESKRKREESEREAQRIREESEREAKQKREESEREAKHELWKKLAKERTEKVAFSMSDLNIYDSFAMIKKSKLSSLQLDSDYSLIARDRESQWCVYLVLEIESSKLVEVDSYPNIQNPFISSCVIDKKHAYEFLVARRIREMAIKTIADRQESWRNQLAIDEIEREIKHGLWKKHAKKQKGKAVFSKKDLDVYDAFERSCNTSYPVIARDRESQWCIYLQLDLKSARLVETDSYSLNWQSSFRYDIGQDYAYDILNKDLDTRRKAEKEKRDIGQAYVKKTQKFVKEALANPVKLIYDNTKVKPYCVKVFDGYNYVQVSGWFAVKENAEKVYQRQLKEYKKPDKLLMDIE